MMAEGYEAGFGFLPRTAIDQHFSQRGRQPDLLPVIARHPAYLGIGIDEATALVVTGTQAAVIGEHAAHFVTQSRLQSVLQQGKLPETPKDAAALYVTVPAGESLDLATLDLESAVAPDLQ
ncbi:MAG: hypothetical protein KDA85_14710 [Planctomycetaceae bacterium]|nr:hypothetical protein [Planctomycetaceae bacterium]